MRIRSLPVLSLLVASAAAEAQTGKYAPLAAQLPASARALGLGEAYVAVRDVDAIFYNASQLAGARPGIGASVQRYLGSATALSLASAIPFGNTLGVGIGIQHMRFDTPPVVLYPADLTRQGVGAGASTVATLGAAMTFKGVRVGAAAKYLEESSAMGRRASAGAADLGAAKDFGQLTVGLAVQDVGGALDVRGAGTSLPTRVTAGVAGFGLPVGPVDAGFSSALSVRRDGRVIPALGTELTWIPIEGIGLTGRLGVRVPESRAGSPVTFGASAFLDRVTLDYAAERYAGLGSGHRVGLRVR